MGAVVIAIISTLLFLIIVVYLIMHRKDIVLPEFPFSIGLVGPVATPHIKEDDSVICKICSNHSKGISCQVDYGSVQTSGVMSTVITTTSRRMGSEKVFICSECAEYMKTTSEIEANAWRVLKKELKQRAEFMKKIPKGAELGNFTHDCRERVLKEKAESLINSNSLENINTPQLYPIIIKSFDKLRELSFQKPILLFVHEYDENCIVDGLVDFIKILPSINLGAADAGVFICWWSADKNELYQVVKDNLPAFNWILFKNGEVVTLMKAGAIVGTGGRSILVANELLRRYKNR